MLWLHADDAVYDILPAIQVPVIAFIIIIAAPGKAAHILYVMQVYILPGTFIQRVCYRFVCYAEIKIIRIIAAAVDRANAILYLPFVGFKYITLAGKLEQAAIAYTFTVYFVVVPVAVHNTCQQQEQNTKKYNFTHAEKKLDEQI